MSGDGSVVGKQWITEGHEEPWGGGCVHGAECDAALTNAYIGQNSSDLVLENVSL